MEKIELEFDSNLISTEQVLEKISEIVKYAKDQGLHLRELELEAEAGDKEEED
jgi:isopropylmalate/homocitrate/citramalate synthase